MILSILICTLPQRRSMLERLIERLNNTSVDVEIIMNQDVDITTGAKRNILLNNAKGDYICFIDDDDLVSKDYIKNIIDCVSRYKPDVIGLNGIITTNGLNPKPFLHSMRYSSWYEEDGIYYRYPNHLNPVKRSIALQIMFPDITMAEDKDYSARLYKYLIDNAYSEIYIEPVMYHYLFISNKKV